MKLKLFFILAAVMANEAHSITHEAMMQIQARVRAARNRNACPEKTPKEWAEYFIARSSNLSANHDAMIDIWDKCEATFRLQGVAMCAERIIKKARHTKQTTWAGHSMGWEVPDDEYLKSAPAGYLDLPPELRNGLPANIRDIAKNKGWKVLEYDSRTVGNPPNGSYGRTLVLIEGPKVDKWIQFTSDNNRGKGQLIDFIAMEKPTGPNDRGTPYYTQYMRDRNGRNPKVREGFDNCYSCHPNGMRELSPAPGSYSATDKPNLDYMQNLMRAYTAGRGGVDWGGKVHPEDYGPPMGEAQGCVKCHNNGDGRHEFSRGAINSRHDTGHIRHKMSSDYSMPVAMTPMEQDFLQFIEDIPLNLSESERSQFLSLVGSNDNTRFARSIDAMERLGKIKKEEADRWRFILNGHPDYDNCKFDASVPDCFRGLKRYDKMYSQMISQYPEQERAWLTEPCDALLAEDVNGNVNDSSNRDRDDGDLNSYDKEQGGSSR